MQRFCVFHIESVQVEHLRDPHAAAEARGCPGEDSVDVTLVGRDEAPTLCMTQRRESLALSLFVFAGHISRGPGMRGMPSRHSSRERTHLELICLGVYSGAPVERLSKMPVRIASCRGRGHNNVLETHRRTHMWGQVQGRRVTPLVKHRRTSVDGLKVNGSPDAL